MKQAKVKVVAILRFVLIRLPFGANVYRVLSTRRRAREKQENIRNLQIYGWEVLKKVHETLNGKFAYFADFGTLLGLVRERGFIAHDEDMDFGVLPGVSPAELLKTLLANGFEYMQAYEYKDRILEIAVRYSHVHMDFFFYQEKDDIFYVDAFYKKAGVVYPSRNLLTAYQICRPKITGMEVTKCNGVAISIPGNYEEMLVASYGDGWRVPVKDRHAGEVGRYRKVEQPGFAKCGLSKERVFDLG